MNKKLLATIALCLGIATAALAASTSHYGWVLPTVGANQNTWGSILNTAFNNIDTAVWNATGGTTIGVNAPSSSGSNITLTNPVNNVQNISFSTTGKSLILPAMNGSTGLVAGGSMYVNNTGSNTFSILAQDGSTTVLAALGAGQTVILQLTSGSTANGAFNVLGPYLTGTSASIIGNTLVIGSGYSSNSPPTNGALFQGNVAVGNTTGSSLFSVGSAGQFTIDGSGNTATSGTVTLSGLTASELVATNGSSVLTNVTALPNGTTATTQSAGDTTTKVATDGFVNTTALTLASGTTAVTQSASDSSTKVATTAFINGTALTLASGTTATTQSSSDNSTKIATTAFVKSQTNVPTALGIGAVIVSCLNGSTGPVSLSPGGTVAAALLSGPTISSIGNSGVPLQINTGDSITGTWQALQSISGSNLIACGSQNSTFGLFQRVS